MKKILITLLLVSCSAAFAEGYDYIYRGTRTLGMGGAFTAVSDDVNALFYNPAGLNKIKSGEGTITALNPRVEANTSAIHVASKLTGSTKEILTNLTPYIGDNLHLGISAGGIPSIARRNLAIALLLPEFKNSTTLRRTVATEAIENIVVDSGLMVGYAHGFFDDRLSIGADIKFLVRGAGSVVLNAVDLYTKRALNFKDIGGYGFGIDGDVGAMYTFNKVWFFVPTVGLSINNIGATKFPTRFDSSNSVGNLPDKFRLRRSVGLGSKFELPTYSFMKNWIFALDINHIGLEGSFFKKLHLGMEALFFDFLALRGGVNQGYFTFGLGFDMPIVQIDFYTYGEELGESVGMRGDRRIGLQLSFSW